MVSKKEIMIKVIELENARDGYEKFAYELEDKIKELSQIFNDECIDNANVNHKKQLERMDIINKRIDRLEKKYNKSIKKLEYDVKQLYTVLGMGEDSGDDV